MGKVYSEKVTGEPRDTESGHAWFGEGPLEKYPAKTGQLAGGLLYSTHGLEEGSWKSVPKKKNGITRRLPILLPPLPHPAQTDYLYYVLNVEAGDGSHHFYATAAEFAKGKAAYQKWLAGQRGQ